MYVCMYVCTYVCMYVWKGTWIRVSFSICAAQGYTEVCKRDLNQQSTIINSTISLTTVRQVCTYILTVRMSWWYICNYICMYVCMYYIYMSFPRMYVCMYECITYIWAFQVCMYVCMNVQYFHPYAIMHGTFGTTAVFLTLSNSTESLSMSAVVCNTHTYTFVTNTIMMMAILGWIQTSSSCKSRVSAL